MGMSLGIGQAKCGAPGQAEDDPAIDAEHHAQHLNIGDQMSGCVGIEAGVGTTRQWPTAPRPALVEQYGAIKARIEEVPLNVRREGAFGIFAAMQLVSLASIACYNWTARRELAVRSN